MGAAAARRQQGEEATLAAVAAVAAAAAAAVAVAAVAAVVAAAAEEWGMQLVEERAVGVGAEQHVAVLVVGLSQDPSEQGVGYDRLARRSQREVGGVDAENAAQR